MQELLKKARAKEITEKGKIVECKSERMRERVRENYIVRERDRQGERKREREDLLIGKCLRMRAYNPPRTKINVTDCHLLELCALTTVFFWFEILFAYHDLLFLIVNSIFVMERNVSLLLLLLAGNVRMLLPLPDF